MKMKNTQEPRHSSDQYRKASKESLNEMDDIEPAIAHAFARICNLSVDATDEQVLGALVGEHMDSEAQREAMRMLPRDLDIAQSNLSEFESMGYGTWLKKSGYDNSQQPLWRTGGDVNDYWSEYQKTREGLTARIATAQEAVDQSAPNRFFVQGLKSARTQEEMDAWHRVAVLSELDEYGLAESSDMKDRAYIAGLVAESVLRCADNSAEDIDAAAALWVGINNGEVGASETVKKIMYGTRVSHKVNLGDFGIYQLGGEFTRETCDDFAYFRSRMNMYDHKAALPEPTVDNIAKYFVNSSADLPGSYYRGLRVYAEMVREHEADAPGSRKRDSAQAIDGLTQLFANTMEMLADSEGANNANARKLRDALTQDGGGQSRYGDLSIKRASVVKLANMLTHLENSALPPGAYPQEILKDTDENITEVFSRITGFAAKYVNVEASQDPVLHDKVLDIYACVALGVEINMTQVVTDSSRGVATRKFDAEDTLSLRKRSHRAYNVKKSGYGYVS
ncbi:hypothetical protein I8H83_01025 [Candidatus Saccharibacteria bacterium]|nr:hypothetical protein [Candidatus Saccharibacteria bacterium]